MAEIIIKKMKLSNGETIAYRERLGGTENVLLIHGNMNSSKHWDVVLEKMDPKYKLYAIDLRGFGLSSYHQQIRSIKDLADDVKEFVAQLELMDFALVGWSTGGAVSMQFVAENPGKCTKLILLASASTRGYPLYESMENGLPDISRRVQTYEETKVQKTKVVTTEHAYSTKNRDFLKQVYNAVIYTKNKPSLDHYEEYIDDMLTQRNYAEILHALNTFNISNEFNGLIEGNGLVDKITLPTLVLLGDRDLVVTKQMTEEILLDIGENASFVELKDCGHSPLIDDLEQLLEKITEFLHKLSEGDMYAFKR